VLSLLDAPILFRSAERGKSRFIQLLHSHSGAQRIRRTRDHRHRRRYSAQIILGRFPTPVFSRQRRGVD